MKITFNAPFTLTFTLASVLVFFLFQHHGLPPRMCILEGTFQPAKWEWYVSLVGYTLGHGNLQHLLGNFSIILLLGPILEEHYGTKRVLYMVSLTGLITAAIHILFWDYSLIGASGIVFMFIVLSSLLHIKGREIPITFILIVLLFLGQEIFSSFKDDNISQFAHITGGVIGMFFGYFHKKA
jgi:GlpG protein